MREIRPSGSEGGGIETNRHSLPLFDCEGTEPDNRGGRDKSAFTRVSTRYARPRHAFRRELSSTPSKRARILAQPQSETHHGRCCTDRHRMGFAALSPSYTSTKYAYHDNISFYISAMEIQSMKCFDSETSQHLPVRTQKFPVFQRTGNLMQITVFT